MKYISSSKLVGLGKLERERLSAVLRETDVTISITEVVRILNVSRTKAGKLLAHYAKKGWLTRIHPGVYLPVPLEAESNSVVLDDAWAIAEKLFFPCYISGWSAAEYWGMTDQLFQSVIVMTSQQKKKYRFVIQQVEYILHLLKPTAFFGLKTIWRSNIKIQMADPTRLIVDLMNNPSIGGGIRSTIDILQCYFFSSKKSNDLLICYLKKLDNGAAYKRLGFLIEKYFDGNDDLINICQTHMTTGYAKLDPCLDCDQLIKRWRLFVPSSGKLL